MSKISDNQQQPSLFSPANDTNYGTNAPLAYRARPKSFSDFFGQQELKDDFLFLQSTKIPGGLILFGPPGSGKTTLAYLLAQNSDIELYPFNAVLGGVNDLRKLINRALEMTAINKKRIVIFIDEIHRFNRSQQDALLPYVESGDFALIGATTQNPRVTINNSLLSRLQIVELKPLKPSALKEILCRVRKEFSLDLSDPILNFISNVSNGDARRALNSVEMLERIAEKRGKKLSEIKLEEVKPSILKNARNFDRAGDRHYDVVSAFIKSLRGSDPHAAILWLAVMLDGGEDPLFIARRLVIFASEDVGNADPRALTISINSLQAVQNIGMPEARITLAQAVTYLASTVKSNAAYQALKAAQNYVEQNPNIEVPDHLKNYPPPGSKKYLYPHDYPGNFIKQDYTPNVIPKFYHPTLIGQERFLNERLNKLDDQSN